MFQHVNMFHVVISVLLITEMARGILKAKKGESVHVTFKMTMLKKKLMSYVF